MGGHFCDGGPIQGNSECLYEPVFIIGIIAIICQGVGIVVYLDDGIPRTVTCIMFHLSHGSNRTAIIRNGKRSDIAIISMTGIGQHIGVRIHF